jgi:hypothetical protein
MKFGTISTLLALVFLAALPAYATDTGSVRGTVVDANGAPVPAAAITLVSQPHVYRLNSDAQSSSPSSRRGATISS